MGTWNQKEYWKGYRAAKAMDYECGENAMYSEYSYGLNGNLIHSVVDGRGTWTFARSNWRKAGGSLHRLTNVYSEVLWRIYGGLQWLST